MITIKEGTFQMLRPIYSPRLRAWIVGAIVGAEKGMAYTKRVPRPRDIPMEIERIRSQIERDHSGIKEDPFLFGQGQKGRTP